MVVARAKQIQARRAALRQEDGDRVIATNRRARHDYDILDTLECGIVLTGSEVKSLRNGHAQIADGYARIEDGELWIMNVHIPPWTYAVGFGSHDPDRRRKLLVHHHEMHRWDMQLRTQPLTLIPLSLYFSEGRVKVSLALARGRTHHDRRQAIAERDARREMDRASKRAAQHDA